MSSNKLIGAGIGFMIGMLLGLQMCGRRNGDNTLAFSFAAILGVLCAISGALIAKDKKNE